MSVNVKVAVRCRPLSSREQQRGAKSIINIEDSKCVYIQNPEDGGAKKQFTFDNSYDDKTTQSRVYNDIGKPIVDKGLEGFNGTIFAYGQTGSGKSHSMMGTGDDVGIIPLMNKDIFERVESIMKQEDNTKFLITVSYLEIYNEVVKDLLNPSDKFLKIREHPDMGIYVENLAELIVRSPEDVENLINQGNNVRQVAATQMNERSSRSHSCFTIKIDCKSTEQVGDVTREVALAAKINLVDLAGSERAARTGATGDRLKEGAAINKSLSALGNVINMLADRSKKGHVPYRDSKLTRLLQESLGGNSLTVMIAAISPADDNYDETIGTLQYADRAKSIKNETKKNEDVNEKMIRELRDEIKRLRELVQAPNGGDVSSSSATLSNTNSTGRGGADENSEEHMSQMEEMIANLERAKQQSWEEKERLAQLYEEERKKALANEKNVLQFMQTVKEEKVEAIKRTKNLQQQKAKLSKKFREKKLKYSANKAALQADMATYQNILDVVDKIETEAEAEEREVELQALLGKIEESRASLISERDLMALIKEKQKEIDDQLVEERAEMAAQSAVLQEDDKLRKAIQEDERNKMEQMKNQYLESALSDERQRLLEETELERKRLEKQFNGKSEWFEKEVQMKEQLLLQKQNVRRLKEKLKTNASNNVQAYEKTNAELQVFVREISTAFASEKMQMEKKYHEAILMLKKSQQDIMFLTRRNAELEKELAIAQAWEP